MNSNDRDCPLGVFTMFPPDSLPANLLSNNGGGLMRNLDRMAVRAADEAIAEFMASPEAQAAAESIKQEAALALERITGGAVVELASSGSATIVYDGDTWRRPKQVHCRGRWRAVKRKMQALAAELGWPGCMEVASYDQIEGAVLTAGARLAAWNKLSRVRRKPADRRADRRHRKTLRANLRDPDYVPF